LDGLQSRTNCDVVLIVDCCYAGGFVQRCKATTGQRRLVFAATTPTNYSIFTPPKGADSFSSFFFSFAILGNSLADSFDWTKTIFQSMGRPAGQDPQATADGDDDWDKWDRAIARNYVLGCRPAFGLNAPTILSVATTQTILLGRPTTLWARLDPAVAAKEVWAVIIPPDVQSAPGQPVTSLTRVNLTYIAAVNRWQAVWTPGPSHRWRCRIVYFAVSEDSLKTRLLATPMTSGLNVFATSVHVPWLLFE